MALISYTSQWSFRKIGTMGTLGPKGRSSRPRAESGGGVLGEGVASLLPTNYGSGVAM